MFLSRAATATALPSCLAVRVPVNPSSFPIAAALSLRCASNASISPRPPAAVRCRLAPFSAAAAAPAPAPAKAKVPVDLVQKVRRRTLAGVMDCRDALEETSHDVEKAVALLIERGKQAQGRDGREAAEGSLMAGSCGTSAFILELNSETDFVGKSAAFKDLVARIRASALAAISKNALPIDNTTHTMDLAAVGALPTTIAEGTPSTVTEAVSMLTSQVGEALRLRKARGLTIANGAVGTYVHNGRVAALVAVEAPAAPPLTPAQQAAVQRLADALAVQTVGYGALFISEMPAGWLDRQRHLHEQKDAETPGGIGKFQEKSVVGQAVLMEQRLGEPYNRPVRTVLATVAAEVGLPGLEVTHLLKEQLGDGAKVAA